MLHYLNEGLLPKVINIELTNKCNLVCKMCYRNEMEYPEGSMDITLFDYIIKKIKDEKLILKKVYLHWRGEPLLVDYVPYAIEQIKTNLDTKVILFTNGTLLDNKLAEAVIRADPDLVSFSMDANSSETYKNIRGYNAIDIVKENMLDFLSLRQLIGSDVKVNINTVLLSENWFELRELVAAWERKVDKIIIKENAMRGNQEFKTRNDEEYCPWPFEILYIAWNGFCFPCCMDVKGTTNLGHIQSSSFKSIWNRHAIVTLRKAFTSKEELAPLCKGCSRVLSD